MRFSKHEQATNKAAAIRKNNRDQLPWGRLRELCLEHNMPYTAVWNRIYHKKYPWPLEEALTTPVMTRKETGTFRTAH